MPNLGQAEHGGHRHADAQHRAGRPPGAELQRNWRTTRSSPSRAHRSSAADAALTATGAVISGSDATISARLSARTLNSAVSSGHQPGPEDPVLRHAGHPFWPVSVMPWMKVRWVRKNKMTMGAVAAVAPAITQAQFVV